MKKITKYVLIALALLGTSNAQSQKTYLDSLVLEALQNNPQLKAAKQYALAQRQKVNQVTSWEAPQVGIEFFQTPISSFPNPIKNGTETDYFIQQMFPFPGKLSAMGNVAENNASMYDAQFKALEKEIIRKVKVGYYELYLVQKKIDLNEENQDLLRNFIRIAEQQYEVGMGKQPDIIRAQTELSTLINEGINLHKEKISVEAMFNSLLYRPVNLPVGKVGEIYKNVPKWNFEELAGLAYNSRFELKAMKFNVDMYKYELVASKLEYYPDIMGRLAYKNMPGTSNDFWSAMVGVNIPLAPWSSGRYTAKVQENEINIQSTQERYNNMKNMVSYEVQNVIAKIESNRNLVELYLNTVIPQAEQTLQATTAAYKTGKTEFLMLIDAYRVLLSAKLDYYMSVMNFMSSQAELEQALGLSVEQIINEIK